MSLISKMKVAKLLDKRLVEMAEMLDLCEYGSEDAMKIHNEMDKVTKMRDALYEGKVPKEVFVELVKIFGLAAVLGAVMWYDSHDHTLPLSLTKWIPGPKL